MGKITDELVKPYLESAAELAISVGYLTTQVLHQRLKVDYLRAILLMQYLEEMEIVSPFDGNNIRKALITAEEWQEKKPIIFSKSS